MRIKNIYPYLIALGVCFSSLAQEDRFVDRAGLDISFNAVGDEAVLGVALYASHDLKSWNHGRFYLGAGTFYGAFPNTSKNINEYTKGRTSLIQPVQLHIGHQFLIWKKKLQLRSDLILAPSFFRQRITFDDPRYDLNETFKYSEFVFTSHAKLGLGFKIGKRMNLELFTHLPVINEPIAPLGAGLGILREF